MSESPLQRHRSWAHLPLLVLGALFLFPLLWLVLTSLQPREQVGKIPPEWLPRRHFIVEGGEKKFVTPPETISIDKVLVRLTALAGEPIAAPVKEGAAPGDLPAPDPASPDAVPNEAAPEAPPVEAAAPKKVIVDSVGKEVLVPAESFDGKIAVVREEDADRVVDRRYQAELIQKVPKTFVFVKEWKLSKYDDHAPKNLYVPADSVQVVIEPVVGNYGESIRALTAGEEEKSLGLGELVTRSSWPWTPRDTEGQTITFVTYLSNTLVVALLSVVGTTLSSALVAYGLSRITWKGREALFGVTLATMMVPFPVLMVPLYSVFRGLNWIGTLMPLWVPSFFGSAFSVFLLRQFFMTIPKELSEAARIDGCSEFQIFWRIILPLAKPALSVVALFQFMFVYNDFLGPLIFLTEPDTFTMALGLQQYQSQHGGAEWHLLMAASVMLITPVIVLFFFTQRTFIQGISTTGMKG